MVMNLVLIEQGDLLYKYLEQFFKAWFSWIQLLCYIWIVYSWRRSTVTDGWCKYQTSNDVFSRCKRVHKMATGKSDDELIQLDDKMRIGTRSGKLKIVDWTWWLGGKAWRGRQWQHLWLRGTPRHGHQWQHQWLRGAARCVHHWPLPLTSTWARMVCAHSLISFVFSFTSSHAHAPWLKCWVFSCHFHSSCPCECFSSTWLSFSISCTSSRPLSSSSSSWSSWWTCTLR